METDDSANNQKLPISGDVTAKFTIYSSAVHKVVVMVNAGILGLLQLVNQQSSVLETHKAAFLSFCVLVLFYAVLRVREAIYVRLRPGLVMTLVGHASHLFGGLAALVLIYVVSAAFAMVLLFLWFLWLFTVVYKNFSEVMIIYSEKYKSGTGLPQLLLELVFDKNGFDHCYGGVSGEDVHRNDRFLGTMESLLRALRGGVLECQKRSSFE